VGKYVHRLLRRRAENPHADERRQIPPPNSVSRSTACRAGEVPIASSTSCPNPAASQVGRGCHANGARCAAGRDTRADTAAGMSAGTTHDDAAILRLIPAGVTPRKTQSALLTLDRDRVLDRGHGAPCTPIRRLPQELRERRLTQACTVVELGACILTHHLRGARRSPGLVECA
jgi:hypothetical protein